jgi:acyl-CoA reductase-like NAD-dependent aldehyde dehydrogenase
MKSAFANNGQTYDSIKRLYVKEQIYSQVVEGLKERILQLKLGDPKDESTDLGPLAIPEAASSLEELVFLR